jgi:hypothetical protein
MKKKYFVKPRINLGLKVMRPWRVIETQNENKWIDGEINNKGDV